MNKSKEKTEKQRELSEMDKLYAELYGEKFPKAGTAYERLTDAALRILTNNPVLYDQFVVGLSGERKQLDGILQTPKGDVMVEAKDYGIRNAKVGYKDIAKLEGTLTDMEMVGGILASATDFTDPTKAYAKGTHTNERQLPITLFNIRKSTEEDRKGRIESILLTLQIIQPDFTPQSLRVQFSKEAEALLQQDFLKPGEEKTNIHIEARVFYDKEGKEKITIRQIEENIAKMVSMDDESQVKLEGLYPLDSCYVSIEGKLYPIAGLKYIVPILRGSVTSEIKGKGKPVLYVKSDDGQYDKLLTDEELKSIRFEDGEVKINCKN